MPKRKKVRKKLSQFEKKLIEKKKIAKGLFSIRLLEQRVIKKKGLKKKVIFKQISSDDFNPKKFYKLFIRHKASGQERLLAIGKFNTLPIFSQQEQRKGFFLAGRRFKPLPIPKKGKGNWVPRTQIIAMFDKELRAKGRELKIESAGLLIPTKRFYHKKWQVFSDTFLAGTKKTKMLFAHVLVKFEYPRRQWVNKQFVPIEFQRPIMIKNLNKHTLRFEDMLNLQLEFLHPSADAVFVIKINGYIPL